MGLDCHAVYADGRIADDLFADAGMSLIGMCEGSFRLGCYTRFVEEATGFDIHGHMDTRLRDDDIADLVRRLRACDALAHGKWLHDTRSATAVLEDLIKYFELCQAHGLEVLLL